MGLNTQYHVEVIGGFAVQSLRLQPPSQKVVRPLKPTPTTFSGGGWSPRELKFILDSYIHMIGSTSAGIFHLFLRTRQSLAE